MSKLDRRDFLKDTAKVTAGAAVGIGALKNSAASWAGANDTIRVAVLGMRRGNSHIHGLNRLENVEVVTLCDVDESRMNEKAAELKAEEGYEYKVENLEPDLRKVMEDDSIDLVSIATPNHWHSLAAIWACQAGKDVYVEKPLSHNVWEGRQLVKAAKKYNRIVQHGTQIRSSEGIQEAVQKLRDGAIGEVYMAKGLCYKNRGDIGKTYAAEVPEGLHYDIWTGPAPLKPYREFDTDRRIHYKWHWQWAYGNGDIGNQGVHQMDVARWGLGVDLPSKVTSTGGHFLFDDDQETPNCIHSSFVYPDAGKRGLILNFEVRGWSTNNEGGVQIGNIFYGSEGYMYIDSYSRYTIVPRDGEKVTVDVGGDHYANCIKAVRSRKESDLNAPVEEGHFSSSLCHLANVSYRLGRSLEFDPKTERFVDDKEADGMLTRNYRAPYTVPENV